MHWHRVATSTGFLVGAPRPDGKQMQQGLSEPKVPSV
jgi:hypothetical protein